MGKCNYCENDAVDTCKHCNKRMCFGCQFNSDVSVDEGGGYSVECWWSVCKKCEYKHREIHY